MRPFICIALAIGSALVSSAIAACSDAAPLPADPDASPVPEADATFADAGDAGVDALPPYDGEPVAVTCETSPCAVRLVAGWTHYCAIFDDRSVRCWGQSDLRGVPPDGGVAPVKVQGLAGVADLVADLVTMGTRTCALLAGGGVECWGSDSATPAPLTDAPPSKHVDVGAEMSCAITLKGALECWGDSRFFGTGRRTIDLGGRTASNVLIPGYTAFVLDSDLELRSWGADRMLLGRELSVVTDFVPRPLRGLSKVRSVATSTSHACAVTMEGQLFCWGAAGQAKLGVGYVRDEPYPVEVAFPPDDRPQQISVSESHSCVRTSAGRVRCWGGTNLSGELGVPKQAPVYVPTPVEDAPAAIVSVATAIASTCALTRGGAVWCWGLDDQGQLGGGNMDTDRHPIPTRVAFP